METLKSQALRKEAKPKTTKVAQLDTPFYEGLIEATLRSVAQVSYQSDSELERDLEEIRGRLKGEGMSFLTKTLPSLGKALDRALATDTPLAVTGFKLRKDSKLPLFMGSCFEGIFEPTGMERSDASPLAVMAVRQVAYMFYKLNLPPTAEQCDEVIAQFLNTDETLTNSCKDLTGTPAQDWIIRQARLLIASILAPVDPINTGSFKPKHGPGAVSTGEKAWQKATFKRYYQRLADKFPYEEHFYYNFSHLTDDLHRYLDLPELDAGTAKVVLVPKDSRGPRLISCEPLEYQWAQQGLMRVMVETIETHEYTRGRVNFTDQTVNQLLALQSSLNGSRVTLDMKEASDRVGLALVKALFPTTWFDALFACRSDSTVLPDGRKVYLKKFAPMGSAVCFPVEALIFWALSVATISYCTGTSPRRNAKRGAVYVYGDDIICDTQNYEYLMRYLPMFDLQFNMDKCCVGRFFRESCGVDAYKGVVVTPLRVRSTWSSSLSGMEYLSYVALHNAANDKGYFHICDYLAGEIQRIRRTPYSESQDSEVIALVDCRKKASHENKRMGFEVRFNEYEHAMEIYSWKVRARTIRARVPGWEEMLRVASTKSPYQDDFAERPWSMAPLLLAPGCITPLNRGVKSRWDVQQPVRAYQYPEPRRVSLKRGWARA